MKIQEAIVLLEILSNKKEDLLFDYPDAPLNKNTIIRESLKQGKKFVLRLKTKEVSFEVPERVIPTGISTSWYIALDCFSIQEFAPSILFASISVESLLNHDKRMHSYRNSLKEKWINLSLKNLKKASEEGIDISALIDRDGKNSEFITRRNKIAHGDYSGYAQFLWEKKPNRDILEKIGITRKQALNQLNRSFRFITTWAKTNPIILLEGAEQIQSATR